MSRCADSTHGILCLPRKDSKEETVSKVQVLQSIPGEKIYGYERVIISPDFYISCIHLRQICSILHKKTVEFLCRFDD
jgi:hypothetical protein